MAKVFITGSADGLGLMAAQHLIGQGHAVTLHARNPERAADAMDAAPGAKGVLVGDLSSLGETKALAGQANRLGRFDAVIHNAGIGYREARRGDSVDGLPPLLAVNTLAPYILTALMERPARLVYLSSGMHRGGDDDIDDLAWNRRRWQGAQAYSDSKLHDILLAFWIARHWQGVFSNAVEPGWVATKMGGPGAPDDLRQGHLTQAWLAVSDDPGACVTGQYFYHLQRREAGRLARDEALQDRLIAACAALTGVTMQEA